MNHDSISAAFEDPTPDRPGDATPTQRLASKIDLLEWELASERKRNEEMARAIDGLKCALKDVSGDLEKALACIANPDGALTFQLRSRIEHIRLLLASKKLK
jgi:hypothetical protein